MRVIYLVYKWCWIIRSDFHRQYAFGEHSPLPAIFLFIIAMHDKHLVHETATRSILDSNVDFESHAIIDSPRPTTTNIPQAPSFSTFSALIIYSTHSLWLKHTGNTWTLVIFFSFDLSLFGSALLVNVYNFNKRAMI